MTKDATTNGTTTKDTIRTILDLWKTVPRDGVDSLIKYLQESDFFSAPCSTQFHLACPGGLARHSLNVYQLLKEKVERFAVSLPHESVVIAGLGHDLCKVNFYKEGGESCTEAQHNYLSSLAKQYGWKCKPFKERFMPDGKLRRDIPAAQASILIDWLKNRSSQPMPALPISWSVDDKLPLGHGEKSLSILQDFIQPHRGREACHPLAHGSNRAGSPLFLSCRVCLQSSDRETPTRDPAFLRRP